MPQPLEPLAVQFEREMALRQGLVRVMKRIPIAAIPYHHRAAAIFALGDSALEFEIFERMVLRANRKAFFRGNEAGPLWDSPAQQHAVQFQTKVEVNTPRVMLLDDKSGSGAKVRAIIGLGSSREVTLRAVSLQPLPKSGRFRIAHSKTPIFGRKKRGAEPSRVA